MTIYDISPPLRPGVATWPGDADFRQSWTARIGPTCPVHVSEIALSTHTGSHLDAPLHYREDGAPIGALDLEACIGRARLVDVSRAQGIVRRADVEHALIPGLERLLLRTRARSHPMVWDSAFIALDPALLADLGRLGLRLIGTDAPSVDPETSKSLDAHRAADAHGILILEGLVLDGVPEDDYELIALPLKLVELDAAPVRAILRELAP